MEVSPQYKIPPAVLASIAWSCLWLQTRSFRSDAQSCLSRLSPPPVLEGREYIPASGPCLVTFNHYSRPGFNIFWLAMAIAAALPVEAHLITTAELTFPGNFYAFVGAPLSRFALGRLAQIYRFTPMPPMPPRSKDLLERARAVRAVLARLSDAPGSFVLLAPEGADQPAGRLSQPPAGAGRFMGLMAARGLSILPAAGWEQAGALHIRFGPPYPLQLPAALSREALDYESSRVVMRAIAALLPQNLRAEFG